LSYYTYEKETLTVEDFAMLLIEEDLEGKNILDLKEDTDDTDSDRERPEAEREDLSSEDGVGAYGSLMATLLLVALDLVSLSSTMTTSYLPASLDASDGSMNEGSDISSIGGRIDEAADGVISNWLELMDWEMLGE
jgi:hypothetical protein